MRGGKRTGVGRPRIDPKLLKVQVGYRLPRDIVEWLRDQHEPVGFLIEQALRKQYKINE